MTERNYYEILGLTPSADGTAVNRTYWHLARKYQAEAISDPRAHRMLDELNEAYGVLGTPVLRSAYDAGHPAAHDARQAPPQQRRGRTGGSGGARGASSRVANRANPAWHALAFAPYAAAIALGGVSLAAGIWSANVLLVGLGTGAALVAGAASMRHTIARVRPRRGVPERLQKSIEPAAERALERSRPLDDDATGVSIARRSGVPVDELRLSTASMVGRWRSAVGATAGVEPQGAERGPDSTLVDIFRSEQELETASEPLSAVLEVLRGSRRPV